MVVVQSLGPVRYAAAAGAPLCAVQDLLGNRDASTTQIYTHVLNRGPAGVRSPVYRMPEA